jgi:cytochrome c5
MTIRIPAAAAAALLLAAHPVPAAAQDKTPSVSRGAEVYHQVCQACHREQVTPEEARTQNLAGPPMNFMTTHMRQKTDHDKAAFVEHVVTYTMNPSREASWAMPRAIERFGLMPSIKVLAPQLDEADLRAVAEWMWQRYDYKEQLELLERHHGPGGMPGGRGGGQGRGMGQGQGKGQGRQAPAD